ncbi:MAG: hypothetical protein WAK13_01840, partial [Terriglobales bacterium]
PFWPLPGDSNHKPVIHITYSPIEAWKSLPKGGTGMDDPSLLSAIDKLAIAGKRAGFTVEQLIRLLNAGVPVDALLQIIAARLCADDLSSSLEATTDRTSPDSRLVN